ncbi:hypothetical protein Tco_1147796 [Tanacetum coccineum]
MFWHYAIDDLMFTTIRVISKHQDIQVYGAILPRYITNQAMLEFEAYKTYRAYATSEKTQKPKSTKKKADSESSPKTKPTQASKGKRIKTLAKGVIPMKIALEKSKTQQHSSHANGSGVDERTGVTPGVPDVTSYDSEAELEVQLRDEAQAENANFIDKLDDNIKKIIKDHVKEQVKAQVSKILPKIEKTVNEQLEAEVLTRSSNESKTPHAVAANLSELELKKILIDKMERNKSIHKSDEQKNLYKVLVDAYEKDKDEEPSARSNRGSKRRRARKEPESTNAPKEKTSKITGKSTEGSKSHHKSHQAEEPMQTAKDLEEPAHQEFKIGVTEDQPDEETS